MLKLKKLNESANAKAFLHLVIAGTAVWKAMQYKRIAGATECLARLAEDHDEGVRSEFEDFEHRGKNYHVYVDRYR